MIQSRTPARHLLLILLSALVGCAATPSKANESSADALAGTESNRETLIDAMGTELERSMDRLKLEDYETPYFIAYQMKDSRQVSLGGKFGALVSNQADR